VREHFHLSAGHDWAPPCHVFENFARATSLVGNGVLQWRYHHVRHAQIVKEFGFRNEPWHQDGVRQVHDISLVPGEVLVLVSAAEDGGHIRTKFLQALYASIEFIAFRTPCAASHVEEDLPVPERSGQFALRGQVELVFQIVVASEGQVQDRRLCRICLVRRIHRS